MQPEIAILLVDDERRNLDALETILDGQGYRLLRAEEADHALRLLLEHDVAAIVLDIKMPGVSGFELARLIKGTKRFRQIPIVFLTAHLVDDRDILTGYGAGAVDYLTKPVNPQILRHKIAVFADLFRKTRALAELNEHLEARVQERTAELEASEAALREASKQKDAFLATLAHELRNPLAPLRTGLDLLLQLAPPEPRVARTLSAMNRQLHHVVRLIDDLLDMSRISRGMLELKKQRTDIATAIQHALEIAQPSIDKKKQTVSVRAPEGIEAVVDATRVSQIVGNLLHNASKFSAAGAEIGVELSAPNGSAIVKVVDRGAGIPPDQIDRAFAMFAKVARSSSSGSDGLGIGLALSRTLAELHGGTLEASSEGEGKGSTFTLTLPGAEMRRAAPEPAPESPRRPPGTLGIVVVEDNDDSADMLAVWLKLMGHEVQVARTGPDGLALILDARPDLVLCDIGLPDMDGVEVCERVRLALAAPPVMIALTGWGMDTDRKRTQDAGFDRHLVKPVALDKLRDIIDGVSRASAAKVAAPS